MTYHIIDYNEKRLQKLPELLSSKMYKKCYYDFEYRVYVDNTNMNSFCDDKIVEEFTEFEQYLKKNLR